VSHPPLTSRHTTGSAGPPKPPGTKKARTNESSESEDNSSSDFEPGEESDEEFDFDEEEKDKDFDGEEEDEEEDEEEEDEEEDEEEEDEVSDEDHNNSASSDNEDVLQGKGKARADSGAHIDEENDDEFGDDFQVPPEDITMHKGDSYVPGSLDDEKDTSAPKAPRRDQFDLGPIGDELFRDAWENYVTAFNRINTKR
jgi:hypothetical protein